jgi:hypothetical protein
MGYVNGLTIQSVPYDFRKSALKNHITDKMKFALKMVNKFTNKKSYLIAHSYGNNNVMNALKGLTQNEKDNWVREYIAVGPPFLGSLQALFFMLGQNSWLYSPSIEKNYGLKWLSKYFDAINPTYARKTYPYIDAIYEFFPRPDQFNESYSKFIEVLPKLKDLGFRDKFVKDLEKDVNFAKTNNLVSRTYATGTENNYYTMDLLDDIVDEMCYSRFSKEYYKQFDYDSLKTNENPGVASRIVYLSEVSTFAGLIVEEDPMTAFDEGRFPASAVISEKGDQTVNLYSLTMAPLVWLGEYLKLVDKKSEEKVELDEGQDNNDPYKSIPKKITLVEFGPDESKTYSSNYEYVHCVDENPTKSYDNQGILETASYYISYFVYRTFKNGQWLIDNLKNLLLSRKVKKNPTFIFPNEIIEQNYSFDEKDDDKPFGSYTCTHGGILSNNSFLTYVAKLFATPEKTEKVEKLELSDVDEKTYEEHLSECIPVTCFKGFDQCWNDFETLFGFK